MKAEDLRVSILQAAVQGKLVPQDPNDEPASILVEHIREEKRRLIKEKKIKADKNESHIYRRDGHWYETINGKNEVCIDDEIPFEVPDSWSWQRGKTCFKKMESTKPSGEYFDYIDIDAIDNKKCIVSSPKRIVSTKAPSRATRALHEGDVLFSTVRPYLRNIAIVDSFLKDCIASTGFYVCSPVEFFDSKYLYWLLISNYVIDGLMVFMKGDNSPSINNSDIENYLFPIPPISEQKRIVQKIEELIPIIEKYGESERELTQLVESFPTDLKASILQAAVQGKLVPQDPNDEPASILVEHICEEKRRLIKEKKIKADKNESHIYRRDGHWYETINGMNETCIDNEIPFGIPESWHYYRLKELSLLTAGQSPDGDTVGEHINGIEFHQGKACFGDKYLQYSFTYTSAPKKIVEENTILLSIRAPIGPINLVNRPISIGRGLCGINPILIDIDYTSAVLKNDSEFLDSKGTGSTFKAITMDVVKQLLIPIPPLNEQKRIVQKIEDLSEQIDSLISINDQTKNNKEKV